MNQDLFRKEAIENRRERLWGNVIVMQPFSFAVLTVVITVITSLIIALLVWGNYARRETVNGFLIPDEGLAKVYARQSGVVLHSSVKEGGFVQAGDQLVTVSTGRSTQDTSDIDAVIINELRNIEIGIEQKIIEERKLQLIESKQLLAYIAALSNEVIQLDAQFITIKEQYQISQNRVDDIKALRAKGYASDNQYLEQHNLSLKAKLEHDNMLQQISIKKGLLQSKKFDVEQLPIKLTLKIKELERSISETKQKRLNIEGQRLFTLHAPTTGRVTALQVHEGQSVSTSKPVMAIIPEGAKFEAHLYVPTRAIGFIETGQKVMIRYAAFPYQRYGLHEGQVSKVAEVILSPDELPSQVQLNEPAYRVIVNLQAQHVKAYGQSLPLQSGMQLEADIILETLSLADWLFDPLYSLKGRS
jgi:membrane fusion protein